MSQARVQSRVQAQARVTDFFSQKKKAPVKQAKQRSHTAAGRSAPKNKDALLSSSSVHQEFLRVIDEAVGLNDRQSTSIHTDKNQPCSPRTPKRTSTDAQFDLGAAAFSATAEHSTSKKRRQEAGRDAEKVTRKTARKKLILPQDTAQTAAQPLHSEVIQQASVSENHDKIQTSSSPQRTHVTRSNRGQASKVLSKDDITALKSRLHRIKKHAEEKISTASSSVPSFSSSPVDPAPTSTSPASTVPPSSDVKTLKSTLVRAKELAAEAQRRKEERETEESRKSETQSQESAEQPAYQRYHTLAQAAPPGLSLPYQYKVLAEMFRSMDTVVAMMHNRHETSTFTKIKQGVQDMMHKRFEESHIGQIKTVFAEAYTFRQEKNIPTFNSSIKRGSYQLTVEPNVHSDQNEACSILSASRLLERRHIFHYNLVSIVKQHHKVFLSSLVPPVSVPEDKLTRWHPRFNVDTVPAVHISPLPQPPHTEKLTTAQEVLDKACSLITPKMEKALVSLALRTEDAESKESTSVNNPPATQTSAPSPTAPAQVPTALKGVSQSLLDRIRAKESQKLQAAMTRNPAHEDRLLMMSRLGELARILRNVFVAEKKPALIMEVVCNKMVGSYRSALSTGDMEKHIRLLAEVAADWLTIHPIRKDFYLKLNKNTELSAVLDKLSSRLKEEERL